MIRKTLAALAVVAAAVTVAPTIVDAWDCPQTFSDIYHRSPQQQAWVDASSKAWIYMGGGMYILKMTVGGDDKYAQNSLKRVFETPICAFVMPPWN